MRKHHPENERIKRRYLLYLREAKRLSEASVDHAAAAIAAFEVSTNYTDFRRFHIEQARRFKRLLEDQTNPSTGKALAKSTTHSRLMAMKAFLQWLADQQGYRSRIRYADAEYFNPSANHGRIARAVRERPTPTLDEIRRVLDAMPAETDIQWRDRAVIAFTILSGARDNAIASLSLKHVDAERRKVYQDAREVRTKRAKTFTSDFFPVGDDIEAIVIEWIAFLKTDRLFGPDDPLFPATEVAVGESGLFEVRGLSRKHWSSAGAIRRIFRDAFKAAGLPYFNPHSFRNTLVALAQSRYMTPEAFKAWSQNLGHEQVLTTFASYGQVSPERQAIIFDELRLTPATTTEEVQPLDEGALEQAIAALRRAARRSAA